MKVYFGSRSKSLVRYMGQTLKVYERAFNYPKRIAYRWACASLQTYKSYQILWLFDSAKMNLMDDVDDFITGIQEYLARKAYTS